MQLSIKPLCILHSVSFLERQASLAASHRNSKRFLNGSVSNDVWRQPVRRCSVPPTDRQKRSVFNGGLETLGIRGAAEDRRPWDLAVLSPIPVWSDQASAGDDPESVTKGNNSLFVFCSQAITVYFHMLCLHRTEMITNKLDSFVKDLEANMILHVGFYLSQLNTPFMITVNCRIVCSRSLFSVELQYFGAVNSL